MFLLLFNATNIFARKIFTSHRPASRARPACLKSGSFVCHDCQRGQLQSPHHEWTPSGLQRCPSVSIGIATVRAAGSSQPTALALAAAVKPAAGLPAFLARLFLFGCALMIFIPANCTPSLPSGNGVSAAILALALFQNIFFC